MWCMHLTHFIGGTERYSFHLCLQGAAAFTLLFSLLPCGGDFLEKGGQALALPFRQGYVVLVCYAWPALSHSVVIFVNFEASSIHHLIVASKSEKHCLHFSCQECLRAWDLAPASYWQSYSALWSQSICKRLFQGFFGDFVDVLPATCFQKNDWSFQSWR